jgi:oligoribonuclease
MTSDSKKHKDNMVWIDMEMTGLDPEKEGIIEVASIVTDKDLNIIDEGPDLVIKQPEKLMKAMDSWNQKHHGSSGLRDAVKKSKINVKKAEKKTLEFIKKYCVPHKNCLCGNSIYQDRRFIIKYMPRLDEFLHYRMIDVSTIKELVRRWYPKDKGLPQKSESHRALADIRESIEELRYYRKHYFK